MPTPPDPNKDPDLAWRKAQTIGASKVGERYAEPTNPGVLDLVRQVLGMGPSRPNTVVNQDPYGIDAWQQGAGPMPMMAATTQPLDARMPGRGTGPDASALAKRIIAWHGSPHDFDKFSLRKVGTGEGNQAFGHGLYFTDTKALAEKYRDDLTEGTTPRITLANGHSFDDPEQFANKFGRRAAGDGWNAYVTAAMEALHPGGTPAEKMIMKPGELTQAQRLIQFGMDEDASTFLPAREKALALLQGHTLNTNTQGKLYQVQLKAHPSQLLNWDRQLAEQSPAVQAAVTKVAGYAPNPATSGGSVYERMADKMPQAQVSRQLRSQGVPGIKYLDGFSRPNAGNRDYVHTSNYVAFDSKIIDILKKYGILPGAAGLGKMLANSPDQEQPEQ
jgi:hypothetical protein